MLFIFLCYLARLEPQLCLGVCLFVFIKLVLTFIFNLYHDDNYQTIYDDITIMNNGRCTILNDSHM